MRVLVLGLFLVMQLISCADPYGTSAKAAADIGAGVGAGLSTVQSLATAGTITKAEAINVAGYLKFVNDQDGAFETCITAAHTSAAVGVFTACAQSFIMTLGTPGELALIHVNNATASQQLATIANGFTAGLQTLTAALGGK